MGYVDYIGNVTRFAVELVNADSSSVDGSFDGLSADARQMLAEHEIAGPTGGDLRPLLNLIREALGQIAAGASPDAVSTMLKRYPPELHLSQHDGAGIPHIHFARNGLAPTRWIGQTVAATLAYVATRDPGLTIGRCAAEGCSRLFVDQSRNRTRRFCANACASRTTVAAHRARTRG